MIEVSIVNHVSYHDDMQLLGRIITWMLTELMINPDNQDIFLQGYLVLYDKEEFAKALLLSKGASQKGLLQILLQPPGEFKGKYIACILNEEPMPVNPPKENDEEIISNSSKSSGSDDDDESDESEGRCEIEVHDESGEKT